MPIRVGNIAIGAQHPLVLIAGLCVIENEAMAFDTAKQLKAICQEISMPFIFKASYDKANRSSIHSFRGPGLQKGLSILNVIKHELQIPVTSDVHSPCEAEAASKILDLIQIPAFLCRQTDLLVAAGQTGKPINVKKGQFLAADAMCHVVEKIHSTGNRQIMLTERGSSFGPADIVVDFRSVQIMRQTGCPIVVDASHAAQSSEFSPLLAIAAASIGVDAIFLEVHPDPAKALSDGKSSVRLSELAFIKTVQQMSDLSRKANK